MRYWIGVASREHVKLGVAGSFCQLCHGKSQPLKRMSVGDWLIYYSSKENFESPVLCQQFTAIGEVIDDEIYPFAMSPGFVPHRRNIRFIPAKDISIRPLIDQLSFIRDKTKWGYAFRFGHFEIPKQDFELIAKNMLAT
ncbi:MAG: EVE domain-containing protein [Verrucomicrobiota bacterium]